MSILYAYYVIGFAPGGLAPPPIPAPLIIQTNDTLATVMGTGYLNGSDVTWGITYQNNLQVALVSTSDKTPVWLAIQIDGSNNVNLVAPSAV